MSGTIVVTGSASGIGRAIAARLQRQGARVIRVDLRGGDVACDLGTAPGRTTLEAEISRLAPEGINGVVACAGLGIAAPQTVAVNYFGAVATLTGLRPLLARARAPRAVLISSRMAIHRALPPLAELLAAGDEAGALAWSERFLAGGDPGASLQLYATTKVAVTRWMRRVAAGAEWAGEGILLNAVAPGLTLTPMTEGALQQSVAGQSLRDYHPVAIGRFGMPEEIAAVVHWLLSPENSLLVGQCVFADGGTEVIERGERSW